MFTTPPLLHKTPTTAELWTQTPVSSKVYRNLANTTEILFTRFKKKNPQTLTNYMAACVVLSALNIP